MKILMISDVYFPRINGVSTSIETFRSELSTLGCEVTLLAPAYPQDEHNNEDERVVRIPSRRVPFDPEDRLMSRAALRAWLRARPRGEFDLVHVQTPFAAHYAGVEAARLLGVPVIASYHTYFEEYLHHYIPLLPRAATRALARRFSRGQCNALDAVIVPSRAMADTLNAYGVRQPLHILPTGLREQHFQPGDGQQFRLRNQIEADRPLLLFVGRVAFEKNIGFLLDVVAQIREAQPRVLLLITGEGPALDGLRTQAGERGLSGNVRFLGYLDRRHELADCYAAADVFVFASRTETQGLVLLEAMAMGKPVLALSAMGTRDILEDTPGTLIAHDEVADFSRKLLTLLADKPLRLQMGQQARLSAQRWSASRLAAELLDLYRKLTDSNAVTEETKPASAAPEALVRRA